MADETLSWELKLFDHMSGVLNATEKRLDALTKSLGNAVGGLRRFAGASKNAAAASSGVVPGVKPAPSGRFDALKRFGDRLFGGPGDNFIGPREQPGRRWTRGRQRLASNLFGQGAEDRVNRRYQAASRFIFGNDDEKNVERMKNGFGKIKMAGAMAAGSIAAVAAAMGAAAAGVVAQSGKWMVSQLNFQESSMATFETMLGSQEAASRVFKQAAAFAAETPFGSEEVISGFQRFLTAGFKEDQLDKLMRASGDVGAAMGTDKMQSVMIALGQIKAKGKLQSEELMQLADAGVGQAGVKDALQATLGKSRAQIDKMLQTGKITGEQGIEAILESIRINLGGGVLGGGMARKSKTLEGIFSSMMDIPSTLLFSSESLGALDPFKELVTNISKSFEKGQPLFKRGVEMFNRISETWAKAFGVIKPEDIEKTLGKAMDLFGDLMSNAGVFLGSFTERMVENLGKMFGDSHDASDRMKNMSKAVADLVTMILWAGEKAIWLIGQAQDLGLGAFWKPLGAAIDYLADADARASQVVGRGDSSHRASGKQKIPDDLFSRWYNNPDLLPAPSGIGMPKDAASGALTSPSVTSNRVTTNIGDIKIIVPEGGDSDVPFLIADRVKRSLPNQIGNFALEQGG